MERANLGRQSAYPPIGLGQEAKEEDGVGGAVRRDKEQYVQEEDEERHYE